MCERADFVSRAVRSGGSGPGHWIMARLGFALLVGLALGSACLGESKPFCQSWLGAPDSDREDLVGGFVEDWFESSGTGIPGNLNFVKCVGGQVLERRGAITEACELYGELEAGIVLGRLVSGGARSCLDLSQIRGPSD